VNRPGGEYRSLGLFWLILGLAVAGVLVVALYLWP
jgi:hypothetical protein